MQRGAVSQARPFARPKQRKNAVDPDQGEATIVAAQVVHARERKDNLMLFVEAIPVAAIIFGIVLFWASARNA